MQNTASDDKSLLNAIREENKKAFDKLFYKYYPILCAYGCHFVELEDAKEIVQDLLLWVWENRKNLVIEYSLKQYLFRAVYHRSINKIEQNELKLRADAIFHEHMLATLQEVDVEELNELGKHLREAIEALPFTYRESFVMHRFQDLSYKEIAAVLNVSTKTVDYRIQQALKILRIKLKDYLPLLLFLSSLACEESIPDKASSDPVFLPINIEWLTHTFSDKLI